MAPEMAGVVAEIAEPTAARPRLDRHGERLAIGHLAFRAQLVEYRFEGDGDRHRDLDLLADFEGIDRLARVGFRFHDHPFRGLRDVVDSACSRARRSARSLMRSS